MVAVTLFVTLSFHHRGPRGHSAAEPQPDLKRNPEPETQNPESGIRNPEWQWKTYKENVSTFNQDVTQTVYGIQITAFGSLERRHSIAQGAAKQTLGIS